MSNGNRESPSEGGTCLIICSSPNGRGIHQYALELERGIAGSTILSPKSNERFVLWEMFGIVRSYQKLRDADSLIFANTRVTPLLWGALKKQTLFVVVHDLIDTVLEDRYKDFTEGRLLYIRRRINSWLLVQSISRADIVIANSESTRLDLQKSGLFQSSRVVVLRPGPSFGREIDNGNKIIDTSMRDRFNGLNIFAIAGQSRNKCIDDYFKMFDILGGKAGINAKMTVVGISEKDLPDHSKAVSIKYSGRIEVIKSVKTNELIEYYLGCDVYVSLSDKEGYGIPVADAMGFNIPVVARDIPPFREISCLERESGGVVLCKDAIECSRFIRENYRLWILSSNDLDSRRRKERIDKYWRFRRSYEEYLKGRLKELWKGSEEE